MPNTYLVLRSITILKVGKKVCERGKQVVMHLCCLKTHSKIKSYSNWPQQAIQTKLNTSLNIPLLICETLKYYTEYSYFMTEHKPINIKAFIK